MAFALSKMKLESYAFNAHGAIPEKFTCEGDDVSPSLTWRDAPDGTRGYAIICHDPDAPLIQNGGYGFVHWLLYNLPGSTTSLSENTGDGTRGKNDFGKTGYGGPMPPEGHGQHHYYFWILALDKPTDLPEGLGLSELLKQLEPHLLGMNRLIGTYQRA
ncbi:YbhB/YbcL family Raf kinase inhibitor-like protein [Halomonas sp. DQ26W]|uniref:YbhB/YbcL family Raf kinase inhibitor-like protein n=1 Tax=Halomonas sp. DQ26W TaxID=2282311 RepID=UPI000DF7B11D|nr:YbhB/YbcL family Raf kinase inhibitor-like protein [Halomonas sp. DQ26W]RDB44048.1 YbhB/YbcL family Raf kinase inhibitor-like protein [Halomonas sp. DQ26W]